MWNTLLLIRAVGGRDGWQELSFYPVEQGRARASTAPAVATAETYQSRQVL
jgi:hypothetical protein